LVSKNERKTITQLSFSVSRITDTLERDIRNPNEHCEVYKTICGSGQELEEFRFMMST
jgi:hypothetical protein